MRQGYSADRAHYAPGMRVEIRDAEWRIQRCERSSDSGYLLTCEGLSELVRGREGRFLTRLEQNIRLLDPRDTELVDDTSSQYRASLLYMDTLIRKTPASGDKIHLGHRAALDPLPYQLDPAIQALSQPRPRILIADAVGLGKTLEAGILVSELIARGRGKRILVLAVKSMLAQFQQELWNRFTIPLVRLDSIGLQRVRNRIPANHNPFHYFDKAIISIDTLKKDIEYRHYLEQAYWDIIIIDEAHNVAERSGRSQRAALAKLLATRSDTLIMLSATPHDGKAESFASLVNMLDPTAIANPSDYAHEDFRDKGLVIRRFKKDVHDQLATHLPEREIAVIHSQASAQEEHAYQELEQASFKTLDGRQGNGGSQLFRTTLKKALYSSPAACLSTIATRITNLKKREDSHERQHDIERLEGLRLAVEAITPQAFSKYQQLLGLLCSGKQSLGWNPKDTDDRLVIFTESIKTLEFLAQHLPADLKLKDKQIAILRGDYSDRDLMATVEAFGRRDSDIRLLLCSDVAAEGINLHHLSHRLIHFDVPWSLMTFQQRNGRIDRYGQTCQPQIRYLVTDSANPTIQGEQRVLEVLIEKDQQASLNIGDPSEFLGSFDVQEEENTVAEFIENHQQFDNTSPFGEDIAALFSAFLDEQQKESASPLEAFVPNKSSTSQLAAATQTLPTLYSSDFDYAAAAIEWLRGQGIALQSDIDPKAQRLTLTAPSDLKARLNYLPSESRPEEDRFILSPDREAIQQEIRQRRDEDSPWAQRQYLWPLHPVMEWLADRALGAFGRHTAPLLRLPSQLQPNQSAFLLQGGYPNRRGYPLVQGWFGFILQDGQITDDLDLSGFLQRLQLVPGKLPNRGEAGDTRALQKQLPTVVKSAETLLHVQKQQEEAYLNQRLNTQMQAMDELKTRHVRQLEQALDASGQMESIKQRRKEDRLSQIDRIFSDYLRWLEDTQMIEDKPYIQVVAAFSGT